MINHLSSFANLVLGVIYHAERRDLSNEPRGAVGLN